ncbi:hypothetical protein ACJIZ3_017110 [Penstemon smallii]|uniref:Uncharacterized protein n=1 Tax=Penstemon smallii TaxID=265156 RepID=A0ABD3SV04_9LAMI
MARTVAKSLAAPLLFLNLIMYLILLGFSSWCLNRYINGQTAHPSMGGNGATGFFLTFAILAAVLGIVSKIAGGSHLRAWRNDSLAAAGSSSIIAWAQISVGGWRGWRLRVVEAFVIILGLTQFLYVLLLHAGLFSSRYGPGYRDMDYGVGAPLGAEPLPKAATATTTTATTGARV